MTEKAIREGLPDGTLLNINVPKGIPKGIRVTKQGFKNARPVISEHIDPRGKLYYWIGEERSGFHAEGGTDFEAVDEGFVSVTPMRSDLTNHKAIETLKKLGTAMNDEFKMSRERMVKKTSRALSNIRRKSFRRDAESAASFFRSRSSQSAGI